MSPKEITDEITLDSKALNTLYGWYFANPVRLPFSSKKGHWMNNAGIEEIRSRLQEASDSTWSMRE